MKFSRLLLGTVFILLFSACEGPAGPPGRDGLNGADGANGANGVNIEGTVLEIRGTFSVDNDYRLFYEFPQTVEVFESDLVLVYLLFEQTDDPNGGDPIDVWRLLPQTRILDQGLLQYNYDHTFIDVNIFLEADFDLGTLLAGDTDNQVFRIAVVPASFGQNASIDLSNLNTVMSKLDLSEASIQKM